MYSGTGVYARVNVKCDKFCKDVSLILVAQDKNHFVAKTFRPPLYFFPFTNRELIYDSNKSQKKQLYMYTNESREKKVCYPSRHTLAGTKNWIFSLNVSLADISQLFVRTLAE